MNNTKTKAVGSTNNHTYHIVIVFFICICLVMGLLCFQYYRRLQQTVKAESSGYLQEISMHISGNASRTINDNFAVLGTIATVIQNTNVTSYEELLPIVNMQQSYWNYQSVMLVDERGVAYDTTGKSVSIGSDEFLRDLVVDRKRAMSSAQMINGQEYITLAIPLEGIIIDGTPMRALAALYDLSTFDQILSMNAFDGKGYAHIIRKDGAVAIPSSSKYATEVGYNVLNTISHAQFEEGEDISQIRRNIEQGVGGQTAFKMNGLWEYMVYTPMDTQEWCLLTFVPVSVVNAKSELLLNITLLLCGFITLAFATLIGFLLLSFYRHKTKLEQIAYVDPITGGNTIQLFYKQAQVLIAQSSKPQYALIYTNIEKFKVLNEQFGRRVCDDLLCSIQYGISHELQQNESMGRFFADNFCVLVEYVNENKLMERFENWYDTSQQYIKNQDIVWLMPIIEFGVYVISNDTMPLPQMIDRAKLALGETTREQRGKMKYAIYDDQIRKLLFREKHLEDMMEQAMEQGEFKVFLQPKYITQEESIGGAEALVRWQSITEGMIYPDEFISLFEKNGFIIQLDLWVFDEVCRIIRQWLDAGLEPVKISVNCSRVHLRNPDFLSCYRNISEKWNVPARYLEIELTENIVFENVEHLIETIDSIHAVGYGCSMDDFGSGYSSLNLIQDIPVDTIKLDKIFFKSEAKDLSRMESVVKSILTMSKSLNMKTVAEGVEELEQVSMLKRLGCDYIQGYYFARPMPIGDFEKLLFGETYDLKAMEGE